MKSYQELLDEYKAIIWDGVSDVEQPTRRFTADEYRAAVQLSPDDEVFFVIKGKRRTIPNAWGSVRRNPWGASDVVEAALWHVKTSIESEYAAQYGNNPDNLEIPGIEWELLETVAMVDQRTSS